MRALFLASQLEHVDALVELLRAQRYKVELARPPHAVEQWREAGHNVVLVDLGLGVERVCEICAAFGRVIPRVEIFVVIVGEPASERDLDALMEAGAHSYIPIDDPKTFSLRARALQFAVRSRARIAALMAEVRESEARYRSVIAVLHEAVVVQRSDGSISAMNASAGRVLGLSDDDIRARRWRDLDWVNIRADGSVVDYDELPALTTLRTGKPMRDVLLGVRKPRGETVWISVNCYPVCADGDDTPVAVVTSFTDVSERRRAEDNFRVVLDRAPDAVLIHLDGRALYVNRRWAELLGYDDPRACIGASILDWIPESHKALIAERLRLRAERGDAPPIEHPLLRRDGALVEVLVFGLPVVYEGRPASIAYARDLTAQRRLETELIASDRLASLGRLAAAVGHEINNPLTYVIGNLSNVANRLRRKGEPEASELASHLDDALEGADRVRRIVKDLRVFSLHPREELAEIDVHAVLDSCARMAENEIRHRARLVRDYGEVPRIRANEARLAQVFLNLLVNAAQALPDGDVEHQAVTISTRARGGRVIIVVEDTGTGIAPEHLAHVFEPFYTTRTERGGTGLGLSICHMLVTAQGGAITIESERSRGTRVTVHLDAATTGR